MRDPLLLREITRWTVLGAGALLMAFAMSLTTRDVYSREYIDAGFERTEKLHAEDLRRIERELDYIRADLQWLVRQQGGTPSGATQAD
jgi:hypothetical protein